VEAAGFSGERGPLSATGERHDEEKKSKVWQNAEERLHGSIKRKKKRKKKVSGFKKRKMSKKGGGMTPTFGELNARIESI